MLRKWSAFVLLLLAMPVLAFAQNTGKLAGTITDAQTGDPLPGATVVLEGTTLGTASDVDGNYFIIGVPVGSYNVQASFVGYQTVTVENVEISSGYTREQNFDLQPGVALDEIVVEYERPLIQKDAIGAPKVVTAEEIENLPVRGAAGVAALSGGVVSNDGSDNLFVRGGREQQVSYYIDGVKVIGGLNSLGVPTQAIAEQEILVGSIPARYGDAQSGIISITTKSGGSQFFGSLEAITSEVLDDFGYNQAAVTLGGPIISQKLSFFVSGQGVFQDDANPYAVETYQLSDDMLDAISANPEVLQYENPDGTMGYVTLPTNLTPGTKSEIEAQLSGLPEGASLTTLQPVRAANVMTADDFEVTTGKRQPDTQYDVTGNLTVNPTSAISVRVGGTFARNDRDNYSYARSLYARNQYEEFLDETYRGFISWQHRLSGATFYQIQAEYTDDQTWRNPVGFSRDVRDALFYGDIDDPRNATLAAYQTLTTSTETDAEGNPVTIYSYGANPNFTDGSRAAGSVAPGTFALPGSGLTRYTQNHDNMFRVSASATTQVGPHQIEFGGEYEQQTQRSFTMAAASLARYYADDNAEQGEGVTRYEDLPFSALNSIATWYGYDPYGLNEVDDEDIAAYIAAGTETNPNFSLGAKSIAPYEPIYYAGYISDKIEFKDLVISLGVRVDVFDNNTQVLKDPLAVAPVIRAGDTSLLGGATIPSSIGSDYAVYFNGGGDVVGFHDLDGNFYDANGQDATFSELSSAGGRPKQLPDTQAFSPDIFTDYEPETTFMPRIGVSFPVTDQALFFASYNVTSQRPSERAYLPFNFYESLTSQNRISNPDLKPEKTTQYELGFRQSLTSRAALQISAFYRTQENLIQVRDVPQAFPGGYQGFRNVDFAVTKGAEFSFDLRRTNNVSVRANYTLSFSQGTGSDASSLGVIAWRSTLAGYSPNFISPTDFDRRHSINLSLDYRLGEGEGPTIFGAKPLSNFGVNIVGKLGSGLPYTRLQPNPQIVTNSFTPDVLGGINEGRLPWTTLIDLRVDRRFTLGGADLTAFLWVQNLLDTNNTLGVYRATGLADNDGYLASTAGVQNAQATGEGLGDPLGEDSYIFNYKSYISGPVNVGGNHSSGFGPYSLPRRTRLGIRLNF